MAVILALYAATIWLAALAYATITGHGAGAVLAWGPVLCSAAVLFLLLADWGIRSAIGWIHWAWRSLATERLRRG